MEMCVFRQRLIAALVMVPLVVAAVLGLESTLLAGLFGLVVLIGAWEWTRMIPMPAPVLRLTYVLGLGFCLWAVWWLPNDALLGGLALGWWLLAAVWLNWPHVGRHAALPKVLIGALLLVPAWWGLLRLHQDPALGPWWVLFLLVLIWVADTGAYLSGRWLGRHKLAPRVSPGKTWEGLLGALLLAGAFIALTGPLLPGTAPPLGALLALGMITVLVSILGDLTLSLFKRQSGLKDSSHLIPGHGGVLDRIDSLCSAAPIFWLGLRVI